MGNELVNEVPPMMIRYRLKADQVEREIELLRPIYEELESTQPDGLSYATFQLEDKVSFVEFVATDGPGRFSQLDPSGPIGPPSTNAANSHRS